MHPLGKSRPLSGCYLQTCCPISSDRGEDYRPIGHLQEESRFPQQSQQRLEQSRLGAHWRPGHLIKRLRSRASLVHPLKSLLLLEVQADQVPV